MLVIAYDLMSYESLFCSFIQCLAKLKYSIVYAELYIRWTASCSVL
jgi:hypothetical protein